MAKTKLLLVNYTEASLIRELLRKDYEITTASTTKGDRSALQAISKNFDLVYFAKFIPPLWDDIDILIHPPSVPIIYGFHSPSIIFKPYRPKNYLDNAIQVMKLVHMKMTKAVTAIHALNITEYKFLRSFGFKIYYAPLGVNTKLFKLGAKSSRFTVVFVSARYQTGADMLINIVSKVLRKAPDVKFILIDLGFLGHYFHLLKNMFSNNIEVLERLPQDEFAQLLSSLHILLFPSRWGSFGLVVLEALSSGMPVVCYDIAGAPRDIVKTHGVGALAKPFNVNEIVNDILEYYELWKKEIGEFQRLSRKCRDVALKYDWSIVAELFDGMFKKIFH